jgi:hypothetical protein
MPRLATQDQKSSLNFNGTSSIINLGRPAAFTALADLTYSVWVKTSGQKAGLFSNGFVSGASGQLLITGSSAAGNTCKINYFQGNNSLSTATPVNVTSPNTWVHVTVTQEGSTAKIFVNGSQAATTTMAQVAASAALDSFIGQGAAGISFLKGSLTGARLWNRALTADEVARVYAGEVPSTGLLARYDLNEGAGTIAYDTSGNGYNGTITAGTWVSDTPTKKRKVVGGNLVFNGDFEYAPPFTAAQTSNGRWIDGTAAGSTTKTVFDWAVIGGGSTPTFSVSIDDTVSHSGTKSLKIVASDATGWAAVSKYTTLGTQTQIPCLPSTSYTLTGWVKTTAGGNVGATIRLREINGVNGIVATTNSTALLGENDWTLLKVTVTTNSATRFLLPMLVYDPNAAGTAWFDDITLTPTTQDTRLAVVDMKSSLSFNGTTSYATFNGVRHTSGIFSLGFWVKPYKPNFDQRLVSCRGYTTDGGFEMEYVGLEDAFHLIFTNSSDGSIGTSGSVYLGRGVWSYVGLTVENSSVKIYVNGTVKNTLTLSGVIGGASSQSLTLGRKSYDPSMYALMNMSQFSFENGAVWTTEQIKQKMTQQPLSATIVAKLDEGAGTTAYDSSGNANNGTITNGTWVRDTPAKKRKTINDNLVYNGDFSIAPPTNVPQTAPYKWLDGTAAGKIAAGASNSTNRVPGVYFWDVQSSGAIMIDTANKFNGKNSLKLSTTGLNAYVAASLGDFNIDDYIYALPTTSYTYSFWMKTEYVSGDAVEGAYINFRCLGGSRTVVLNTNIGSVKTTTGWTKYTGTFTSPSSARYLSVIPRIDGHTGTATLIMDAWFADITLTPTTNTVRGITS